MQYELADIERRCEAALLSQSADVAHGLGHIRRVVKNARAIARAEGAAMEVVMPAAWLHDCVVVPKDSPLRAQASGLAAEQAYAWLKDWQYPEQYLDGIHHAIEAHSFSANIAPRTLEARVVQDADRLDALGAVGLARCLMLGGAMQRELYAEEDPFCEHRTPDDRRSAVDHFYTKLLGLHQTMQTVSGKREAEKRTEFLKAFLEQLREEIA